MRTVLLVGSMLLLTSCSKQEPSTPAADLPHATVVMRDGTRAAGAVAASTPSEITLNLDAGGTRTIAMKDVRRVDYGEKPTPAPASAAAPPAAEPTHEEHYHPPAAAVQSRTRVLPAGTQLPVRVE